jgi:hypothetical protein
MCRRIKTLFNFKPPAPPRVMWIGYCEAQNRRIFPSSNLLC